MNDLISRQAAIDAHCELCGDRDKCNGNICPDVEVFQLLPSAQPEQRWIPCSERLPECEQEVLICTKKKIHIEDRIMQQHTIEERKSGKWEIYVISPFDGEGCRCSECNYEGAPYWNFCPNCGADMRGGQNG